MSEAPSAPTGSDPATEFPERIGPYRILEQLGSGGMGVVYLGEQREPVRRRVALKVIKLGMDSKELLARFEAERQAVSLMQHPNVAHIYDAGTTERGQPWFAMELVKGLPITQYCDEQCLSIRERLRLFTEVCQGVQHAHQKGIMHRDLKPTNVMVTVQDGKPIPKIIDFGLAKALDQSLSAATLYTEQGQILGTPAYMSPEQAGLTQMDVDNRTDVYALGVLLYEILTGELPFRQEDLVSAGVDGMIKMIREAEPPKPSTRVTTLGAHATEVARARGLDEHGLRRGLRGDLDWIVMHSLEKDRARRYQTASELAADLERHLRYEPVFAGPPGLRYRMGRFVRRHRGQVIAAGLIALALVAGLIGTTWFALEAKSQANAAEKRGTEFDQLAGVVLLQSAQDREKELYPAWPAQIDALQTWLRDDAGKLIDKRPQIEDTVSELSDRQSNVESERFLHSTLQGLLGDLDHLEGNLLPAVEQRLEWAQQIEGWTQAHPRATATWEEVAKDLATPIVPQMGLVPIGKNPATGLWEFYDLRSAWDANGDTPPDELPIPKHQPDGSIEPSAEMGLVMILIPGGTFVLGAEREPEPDSEIVAQLDATAEPNEGPCHEVTLDAFFISRFEMTQGQWFRLSLGEAPSMYQVGHSYSGIGEVQWTHPVESVSWNDCDRLLRQHGMDLPTEAQWEYACRAGTTTRWWCGDEASSVEGVGNVFELSAFALYPEWGTPEVKFEDGYAGPAPVGHYRANPWGLYDLHGNVMEWCRDAHGLYSEPVRAGDGLRLRDLGDGTVMIRDGCHQMPVNNARSAARDRNSPTIRFALLGVRPMRPVR